MKRASTTYLPLSKALVEVFFVDRNYLMWRSPVIPVPYGAVQRRRNICCVYKFGQDLLQVDEIRTTVRRTVQKVRSKKVISQNVGPNNDQEVILSCTGSRTMRVLLRPHMGTMLINVLLFLCFSLLLCPIAANNGVLEPAFLCDSKLSVYPLCNDSGSLSVW
ncbi:hypothetical protein TNCV_3813851 [Trichonephila clavipes]|nr:hypothetical protein TNCV_3813851 [Trichonephila clavipes]